MATETALRWDRVPMIDRAVRLSPAARGRLACRAAAAGLTLAEAARRLVWRGLLDRPRLDLRAAARQDGRLYPIKIRLRLPPAMAWQVDAWAAAEGVPRAVLLRALLGRLLLEEEGEDPA